ncbi:MAG: phosphoribosylformylglycinamidine synthase subunit PurS [Bacteroidota bacterium]|nr:phosphoribosylformylglycinamidine synthase subunit PurS [Bacteroidota bacterium]MDP4232211.1 phosphoribosylformylglycinamidine synthase subunit PurS [Bacteroidota bacterium]MDP4243608.1 phosphoribosylformylglycinamidine synthase subunit PurS [Bacteroidota bacterium]MDP4288739.1 phosphoribosylformylglycinamidine synthase subunit PurS [Bacteroidota bacterium]
MKYFVYIAIERKEAILDPQGKAIEHALGSLGFDQIENTRVGKLIRLTVDAPTSDEARSVAEQASEKLLANPIMETFSVIHVSDEPVLAQVAV